METAVAAGDFQALVAAVQAAGLVETLGNGPFTVFAPNDDAFKRLPGKKLKSLLKPENKDQLAAILTYMNACQQIVDFGSDAMPASVTTSLKDAIDRAKHSRHSTARAWALRHGMDAAMQGIEQMMAAAD